MCKNIPLLTAKDVELRVQSQGNGWVNLLVYKDARCDMRILDDTFGAMNWKREHTVVNDNLFCTVSVWDEDTYTIIYLKMMLYSINKNGYIEFEGTDCDLAKNLAFELDEDYNNIVMTIGFLKSQGLMTEIGENVRFRGKQMEWTQENIDYVKAHAKMGNIALAKHFGVTVHSIESVKQKHKLTCNRVWTEKEIEYLERHMMLQDFCEIAEYLGRSVEAVTRKANELGFRSDRWWTRDEEIYLKRHYKDSLGDLAKALNRSKDCVRAKRNRMIKHKRPKPNSFNVWTESELEYLKANFHKGHFKTMAERLKRTIGAIKTQGYKMGLSTIYSEYIRLKQVLRALKGTTIQPYHYRWADKVGIPYKKVGKGKGSKKLVDVLEFWEWAEKNKEILDFAYLEYYEFGYEPIWVEEKRNADRLAKAREKWGN